MKWIFETCGLTFGIGCDPTFFGNVQEFGPSVNPDVILRLTAAFNELRETTS